MLDGRIVTVPEDYYDEEILESAGRIEARFGMFRKAARVIGETIGMAEIDTGDSFIEYRIRQLIKNGALVYEGTLDAMRYYSVSLADGGSPEERMNRRMDMAGMVKLRSLLHEWIDINVRERRVMEELMNMDLRRLGLPERTGHDPESETISDLIVQLHATHQPHDRNRVRMVEQVSQLVQAFATTVERKSVGETRTESDE